VKIKNLEHPKTMPCLVNLLIDQKVKDPINVIQEMEGLIENPERVGEKAEIGVTEMEAIVTSGQAIEKKALKEMTETIDQTIGAKEKTEAIVTSGQAMEEKALKEMTETIDQQVEVLAIQIEEIKDLKSHTVMVGM